MKNTKNFKLIVLFVALCFGTSLRSQQNCGEDALLNIQKTNLKDYDDILKRNNLEIKNYIESHFSNNNSGKTAAANYIIPIVFHVVYPVGQAYGTGNNISYSQIQSQVDALNAAFSKNYPAYNGQTHPVYAQNSSIQFCLAKIAKPVAPGFYNGPGGIENGVMRYPDNVLTNHVMSNAGATALLGLTHPTASQFPFSDYLNIWVVSSINTGVAGTTMGYAPKPIMGAYPLDGVVMRSDIIGDNSTGNTFVLGFGLTQGKVLAHEIGHYLNLYHIFQGGCSGLNAAGAVTDACDLNGDMICDIEPCTTQNINCNLPVPNTCVATYTTGTTNLDMINSYMSYADDDCMNTFTSNQTQRMWTTLNILRNNLWQTSNLASTGVLGVGGCLNPFLMSNINPSTNNICANTPFSLTNPIAGNSAISWNWSLTGGSPAAATTNSVIVTYTNPGLYWAKLSVSDGTLTLKDSFLVKVANCVLDSTRLERAHWYFADYAEINFNTPVATPGTSALTYSTMFHGRESTVSMSDSKGNLLFYTNSQRLWDNNHVQRNVVTPIFPIVDSITGSSTDGVVAIPYPKDSTKYIIISSPHSGADYDSIYYVVYDINTKILTKRKGFQHPLLPVKYSEAMVVAPHCNGTDYWVICRPYLGNPNDDRAYSILITAAGPGQITKVTVTNSITPACCGQIKTNRKGNKIIQALYNYGPLGYLYDFNQASGLLKNETSIGVTGSGLSTGAIISPNDSLGYILHWPPSGDVILWQIDLITLATRTLSVPTGFKTLQMECGPDNNIYISQSVGPATKIGRIINTNSWLNAAYVSNAITFPPGEDSFGGLCNFLDADEKPPIANDFLFTQTTCNTFNFKVDSCWQVYNVKWDFGDGSSTTGLVANHSYTNTGLFSVKMTLSSGTYSLPIVIKNISVLSATTTISGPNVICKGSPFINSYGVSNIPGATYNWNMVNGTIVGPNNISNINAGSGAIGVATLSVQIVNGGCTTVATKTIVIDTIPNIIFTNSLTVCLGNTLALGATPVGGMFSGTGVTGTVFNSTLTGLGTQTVNYAYTNPNGCYNMASKTITVSTCAGINELGGTNSLINIYPNPNNGEFTVSINKTGNNLVMEVYNYLGQIIRSENLNAENTKINLNENSNGIYFVRILENNKPVYNNKIIKE